MLYDSAIQSKYFSMIYLPKREMDICCDNKLIWVLLCESQRHDMKKLGRVQWNLKTAWNYSRVLVPVLFLKEIFTVWYWRKKKITNGLGIQPLLGFSFFVISVSVSYFHHLIKIEELLKFDFGFYGLSNRWCLLLFRKKCCYLIPKYVT